jgi:hypothetical protein
MCCAPYDLDFPSTSGSWVRTNPTSGRVGSAFDPAGMPVAEIAGQRPREAGESALPPLEAAAAGETSAAEQGLPVMPEGQSVIPRRMGENYLPTQP